MKIVGVIPARWGSTRFEGKVLAGILGKPMLQHVWERARESELLDEILIACDHEKILETAKQFKATAVLTSREHLSGSDRIAEAVKDIECDIVVNIQGDEPLIHHSVIDGLVNALLYDEHAVMATVIKKIGEESELNDPNIVKVVCDRKQYALYFSRSPIPFNRDRTFEECGYFKHLGIYAYRKDFLFTFKNLPKSALETTERLEQLRALEAGYRIKVLETQLETIGVDTPEDLMRVERYLKTRLNNQNIRSRQTKS